MHPIHALGRLPAVVRSALLWSLGWFAIAALVTAALLVVRRPAEASLAAWAPALVIPIKFAIIGFVAGLAFAALFALLLRGRRLADVPPLQVALAGALITGAFVPCFLQAMNVLSGDGMVPWPLVLDDGAITAVFGGLAAYVSHRLALR